MKLATLISQETSGSFDEILFLRHGNDSLDQLMRHRATIEEFTALQPPDTKYDFSNPEKPKISIVVVIAYDRVYGVFRVLGVDTEDEVKKIATEQFLAFDLERGKSPSRRCKKFLLQQLSSTSTNMQVRGWQGRTRTPVQRSGDGFFEEVSVGTSGLALQKEEVAEAFHARVEVSLAESHAKRLERLVNASDAPTRVEVRSFVFTRNPDVVAEVLFQANGVCQACGADAPFVRRTDGAPYLEVHHRTPLAMGGKDCVANAIAICPNCHRKAHYA
ncbi:MAG: HNH endonuclease [Rhodoferax sp.]|uniref:HNH endonuclease n=1 Tax=Rhodoferax sp. TaxID=50421 RepID=UPI0032655737